MFLGNHSSEKMAFNCNTLFEKLTADQVADWLRGLDMKDAMLPYTYYFLHHGVDGKTLLMMTHADLEQLNVLKLGHQELILEAIDLLRNLQCGYVTETLQSLALQLQCKARSLNGMIGLRSVKNDCNQANTSYIGDSQTKSLSIGVLSAVADLVLALKKLVSWMDKAPFRRFHDLHLVRNMIVQLGLDLISMCLRGASVQDTEYNIATLTNTLSETCERLTISSPDSPLDPLYLQPAFLEQATIRKQKMEELGMNIQSVYSGVHLISKIKDMSPADLCGQIEKGNEVILVNHQIVAGWPLKKLVNLLKENPNEVVLLLKKLPHHISPHRHMISNENQSGMDIHVELSSTVPKSVKQLQSNDGERQQFQPIIVGSLTNRVKNEDFNVPKELLDGNDVGNDVFSSGPESLLPLQVDHPVLQQPSIIVGTHTPSHSVLVTGEIDTYTRPKSFTVASTEANCLLEIILNSPAGDNLSDFLKIASHKTNAPPPSTQEVSVLNSASMITESNEDFYTKADKQTDIHCQNHSPTALTATYVQELTSNVIRVNAVTFHSQLQRSLLDDSSKSLLSSESSIGPLQTSASQTFSSHSPQIDEGPTRSEEPDVANMDRHIGFQGVNSEKESSKGGQGSYVCKVVGGVPQKTPVEPKESQINVQRRKKTVSKKVDRRVSCKDLGKGDCEGWLYKRRAKTAIMSSNWQKRWCVIKDLNLFCYHNIESLKAELVIILPAFKVSLVEESEVKTKKFPFKIFNADASFMFASERRDDMAKWMNKMGLASITYSEYVHTRPLPGRFKLPTVVDFSESESDEDTCDGTAGKPEVAIASVNHSADQLQEISLDSSSSHNDLPQLHEKLERQGKSIFGKDHYIDCASAMRCIREPLSLEKMRLRKLTTLQRTLKAKQKELEEIDCMLSANSREVLTEIKQYLQHADSD